MKTARSLYLAAAVTLTLATVGVARLNAERNAPVAVIQLAPIVITGHRIPVVQLARVVITGKRLAPAERTRLASNNGAARV